MGKSPSGSGHLTRQNQKLNSEFFLLQRPLFGIKPRFQFAKVGQEGLNQVAKKKISATAKKKPIAAKTKPAAAKKKAAASAEDTPVIKSKATKKTASAAAAAAPAKKKVASKKPPAKKKVAKKKAASPAAAQSNTPNPFLGNDPLSPVLQFVPYEESEGEEFMNEPQTEHFRGILESWKLLLMEEVDRTLSHMQDEAANFPDPNDRATQESEFTLELRTRDRERKLIRKIDEALKSLEAGEYGFCETCGIDIGVRRLEARPTATLCIDCKVLEEIREKQMG